VKDAYVAPHPSRADALAAAVVATGVSATTLQTRLRERMASWKVPKKIAVLPAFPLNARGKTDTRALQALLGG
jgi:acyl-CoA synthetase (AMP-forming)/AMP-acid ligase II